MVLDSLGLTIIDLERAGAGAYELTALSLGDGVEPAPMSGASFCVIYLTFR
jgi:hypothetical protein